MEKKFNFYEDLDNITLDAKDIMNGSWGFCAKRMSLMLVLALVVLGTVVTLSVMFPSWYVITICVAVGLVLESAIFYGCEIFFLNLSSKLQTSTADLFAGFKKIFKVIGITFSSLFSFVVGLCLFVVFGFRFELSHSMSFFVSYQNAKLKPVECLKQSRRLMNGNRTRLLKLRLKNFGWILLCLTVIGSVWALPYLLVNKSVFYNDLKTDF